MPAKWQQWRVRAGRWCAHADLQSVSALENKMYLRSFDGNDGEVGERREKETGREIGGGEHVAERRGKEEVDEENDCRCRKHGGDRSGDGRVFGGWAIDRNTRELAKLGNKVDGFAWEMKRMADASNRKGKGKARSEVTEDEEEKPDESDGEDEESGNEDGEGESE